MFLQISLILSFWCLLLFKKKGLYGACLLQKCVAIIYQVDLRLQNSNDLCQTAMKLSKRHIERNCLAGVMNNLLNSCRRVSLTTIPASFLRPSYFSFLFLSIPPKQLLSLPGSIKLKKFSKKKTFSLSKQNQYNLVSKQIITQQPSRTKIKKLKTKKQLQELEQKLKFVIGECSFFH